MINFKLYLRPTKNAVGKCSVTIYVNAPDRNGYFKTGVAIPPDMWNDQDKIVKPAYVRAPELNMILQKCMTKINDIIIMYRLEEKPLSFEMLKAAYEKDDSSANFITWAHVEIDKRGDEGISVETRKMHHSVINVLSGFCEKSLPFYAINESMLARYEKYMVMRGNSLNTVHKHMKTLKTYCRRAISSGMMRTNPFAMYRIRKEKTMPDCMTEHQVERLFAHYRSGILSPVQQNVLRAFLFACCTGLRISDLKRVTFGNIQSRMLIFKMWKTRNVAPLKVKIPLTQTAIRLVNDTGRSTGLIFDLKGSDQTLSTNLKKAMGMLDDGSVAHFHAARHTFATHYLRKNKGDIVTLKTLLGHSKIEQTMVYLTLDDNWLSEGMLNFGEWL